MDRQRGWWRRPASVVLAVATAVAMVVAACLPDQRTLVLAATVIVLDAIGVVASVRAGRRGDFTGWQVVAGGRLFSLVSVVVLAADVAHPSATLWWTGTIARLAMFAMLAAVLLRAPARRLAGRQRVAFAAEVVTVLGGGFMPVWYFMINPVLDGQRPSHLWLATIGYPLGDLLLLIAVAIVLLRGTIARLRSGLTLFVAGVACYGIGDGIWWAQQAYLHGAPDLPAFLLACASLLMTVTAVRYRRDERPAPQDETPRVPAWSMHLPIAAVTVGGVLLLIVTIEENDMLPWGGLVIGLIAMTTAILVRQVISLRDSRDLIVSDVLTGLANRAGLDNTIERGLRGREPGVLLLIDLDGFKLVNDAYGHAAGDRMLTAFARHLRGCVRREDVCGRLGGDEFTVWLPGSTAEHAVRVAERIMAAPPIHLAEDVVPTRASIGITTTRPDDTVKDLLRRADVAMYHSKRAGTHGYSLYDPAMVDRRAEEAALAEDLLHALDGDQFHLAYQPIVDLDTGRPLGAEALLRWEHPVHGLVSPARFVPLAERTGAIARIGLWALSTALEQARDWPEECYVSVNMAPRQLAEPTLVHDVLTLLRRTGVAPHRLTLEITESGLVDTTAIPVLRALREHGIRVAIDDFGTGYSSLQYLTRLPVDVLKIDRAFVAELNGTVEGRAIAQAVIHLADILHLTTIAEGIEAGSQTRELLGLGCHQGQGYLYARPLPDADAADFLRTSPISLLEGK